MRTSLALVFASLALAASARAETGPLALHLRGGGAFFVDAPQSKQFGPGFDLALSGEYAFLPQIGVEVLAGYQRFGAVEGGKAASEIRVGAGIRVRPWNDQKGYLLHAGKKPGHQGNLLGNLWVGVTGEYVRTGGLDRGGLEAALGFELSLVDHLQLGPYLAYHHVFQPDTGDGDPADAKVLSVGLAITITGGAVHRSDRDGDGFIDEDDRCPDQPETKNGFQDDDGCPDEKPAPPPPPPEPPPPPAPVKEEPPPPPPAAVIKDNRIEIADQRVFFDVDKDSIKEDAQPILEQVAKLIADHPEIKKVRVEGHADDQGDRAYNKRLSLKRAKSVRRFLVEHGVDPERIETEGFGTSRPLVSDKSDEARAKNRRVEFVIVQPGDAATK